MVCAVWKCQSGHVHSGAVFIDTFDCCNSRAKMVVAAIKNYNVSEKRFVNKGGSSTWRRRSEVAWRNAVELIYDFWIT